MHVYLWRECTGTCVRVFVLVCECMCVCVCVCARACVYTRACVSVFVYQSACISCTHQRLTVKTCTAVPWQQPVLLHLIRVRQNCRSNSSSSSHSLHQYTCMCTTNLLLRVPHTGSSLFSVTILCLFCALLLLYCACPCACACACACVCACACTCASVFFFCQHLPDTKHASHHHAIVVLSAAAAIFLF